MLMPLEKASIVNFLDELKKLLGEIYVIDSLEQLVVKTRETGHVTHRPRALVYPSCVSEVQQVVHLANKHHCKIFACSRGQNWGYGGNNLLDEDTVVIVLERMNRILEVNEELAYAVIEPGVTYEQLNRYLKERGYRLWIDCIDGTPLGSVIGNALDRGIGITPYGDHFANLCGMEVVLPNGTLIHTGGSSPQHTINTWHTHKWGLGPYMEGIFTQSNFGIVTQAGIWLMPQPQAYFSYIFEFDNDENLGSVIDCFRKLALEGVVSSKLHLLSDFVYLTVLTQKIKEGLPKGHVRKEDLQKLRRKYGLTAWSGVAALYGNEAQLAIQKKILRKELKPYGRLLVFSDWEVRWIEKLIKTCERFSILKTLLEKISHRPLSMLSSFPHVHAGMKGNPTSYFLNHAYFKLAQDRPCNDVNPARDGVGLTWFAPVLPFTGKHVVPYLKESRAIFENHGFDFYMAMLMLNPRSIVCLMGILFDKENLEEVKRAQELYDELFRKLHEHRYEQYRAGIACWERIWQDAPELSAFYSLLKRAIDPNQVLAPGKYGIK